MTDYAALARQQLQMQQEANLPAVQSLQAQIPEISTKFAQQRGQLEAEKAPLTQRYNQLLKDITKRTELASSREFGRRGIPLSSGLYESTLAERISPETERIGLEREGGLRDLTNLITQLTGQETEATRMIKNAIASLQSGAAGTGIQNALQMYLAQQQQAQQQAQMSLQERLAQQELTTQQAQAEWERPFKERMYEYELGKPYYKPETGDGGDLLSTIEALRKITGGTQATPQKPSSWQSEPISTSTTQPRYYG